MKSTFFHIALICVIFLGVFSNCSTEECKADSEIDYDISILDTNYEVVEIDDSKPTVVVYYKITITLYNSGPSESENVVVVIIDDDVTEDYPGTKTRVPRPTLDPPVTIPSGESKDFVFGEKDTWMILGAWEHTLTVNVHPNNDESITLCSTTLTINSGDSDNNNATPGFELIAVLGVLIAFALFRKR